MYPISYKSLSVLLIATIFVAASVFLFFKDTHTVEATHDTPATFHDPVELHGYLWSDTIGWISMNCAEGSSTGGSICGTNNYKVSIIPDTNPSDTILGSIEGYAWSDNIGWIKFGGLSSFPSNAYGNAEIRLTSGDYYMYGWARACAGTINGDCSTMTDHADGWDGWISLKSRNVTGALVPHYIRNIGNNFQGHAWGSDVVGWISFDGVSFSAPCSAQTTCSVSYLGTVATDQWCNVEPEVLCTLGQVCTPASPSCSLIVINGTLSANPKLVRKTNTSKLTWSLSNPLDVSTCKVEGTNGEIFTALSGLNRVTIPLTYAQTKYTFSCIPAGGGPFIEVASTTIKSLPNISET